ncbi:MAG: hypothetical protein R3F21_02585 [Myxococcota bacterium]
MENAPSQLPWNALDANLWFVIPVAIFVTLLGLLVALIASRIWYSLGGARDLDRAEFEGRLSRDLRRRWDRDRLIFVLFVVASFALFAFVVYSIDEMLSG